MADLYSNCVILDFDAPITKAQLNRIHVLIINDRGNRFSSVSLPRLREAPVCAFRESNCVVPTIAADEC